MAVPEIWLEVGYISNFYWDGSVPRVLRGHEFNEDDEVVFIIHIQMPPGDTIGSSTLSGYDYSTTDTEEECKHEFSVPGYDPSWNWAYIIIAMEFSGDTPTKGIKAKYFCNGERTLYVYLNEIWSGWRSDPYPITIKPYIQVNNLQISNPPEHACDILTNANCILHGEDEINFACKIKGATGSYDMNIEIWGPKKEASTNIAIFDCEDSCSGSFIISKLSLSFYKGSKNGYLRLHAVGKSSSKYIYSKFYPIKFPTPASHYKNQADCEAAGYYWYNGKCHSNPPSCSELNNQADCERFGCYWWTNETCHAEEQECEIGDTKCDNYDLYECINGKWELKERQSSECGYEKRPSPCPPFGDLDDDGYVTWNDAYLAIYFYTHSWDDVKDKTPLSKEEFMYRMDVNNNGKCDFADWVAIADYSYYNIDTFPICSVSPLPTTPPPTTPPPTTPPPTTPPPTTPPPTTPPPKIPTPPSLPCAITALVIGTPFMCVLPPLRTFRNKFLSKFTIGKKFIHFYYKTLTPFISPKILKLRKLR